MSPHPHGNCLSISLSCSEINSKCISDLAVLLRILGALKCGQINGDSIVLI